MGLKGVAPADLIEVEAPDFYARKVVLCPLCTAKYKKYTGMRTTIYQVEK